MPHHPARLRLEERLQRLAIAARYCADLADQQGLTRAAERLEYLWEDALELGTLLSENRQPTLWSLARPDVRSPARDPAA